MWRAYNLRIADLIAATPEAEGTRLRAQHNLHQIAWRTVAADRPTSLAYLMQDHVGHLRHHLGQIP